MPKHACRVFSLTQVLTVNPTLAQDLWPTCLCPQQTDWGLLMSQAVIFMGFILASNICLGLLVYSLLFQLRKRQLNVVWFSTLYFPLFYFKSFFLSAVCFNSERISENYIPYLISSFQLYQVCFKSSRCFHSLFPDFVLLLPSCVHPCCLHFSAPPSVTFQSRSQRWLALSFPEGASSS